MALTRKMLSAMDIPDEKIDEIINAHTETVNALKEERDSLKDQVKLLETSAKDLESAKSELEKLQSGDWEKKYNDLKEEYATYKNDTETKAVKESKNKAYRKLLLEAGIPEKRVESIMKVTDVDAITLDKEGKIKDADKVTESVKTEWADFIPTTMEKGADVSTPPANNGGTDVKKPSKAAEMALQYRNEHYGNPIKED